MDKNQIIESEEALENNKTKNRDEQFLIL